MKVKATTDLTAAVRGERDANGEEIESDAREIVGESETYEEARDDLFEQVPEGWMIVGGLVVEPARADTYQPRR